MDPRQPAIRGPVAAPGHTRDHEDLAALYALDVLAGDERTVFERHLARCGRCRAVVAGDRAAVSLLDAAAPEREAPPDFKARLMARAERERAAGPVLASHPFRPSESSVATTVRPMRPRREWGAWLLPVAALFLAVIAGTAAIGEQLAGAQVVATRPLEGTAGAGAATVVVRRSGEAALQLTGLASPPAGGVYQAWLIGPEGAPAPAGAASSGSATIPLLGDARGKTVAITVEPRAGATAPSSAPILAARVPA